MNIKKSGIITLGIFIAITSISYCLWVLGITLLWNILKSFNLSNDLMAIVEALSTALAAAAVFGAGFIAYRELSEVLNGRYMDVADRLFEELNSPDSIDARRRIFQTLHGNPEEGIKNLEDEDRDAIKKVLNSLDHVAFLTQSGWIPDSARFFL